jgi:invasion protein IalB
VYYCEEQRTDAYISMAHVICHQTKCSIGSVLDDSPLSTLKSSDKYAFTALIFSSFHVLDFGAMWGYGEGKSGVATT